MELLLPLPRMLFELSWISLIAVVLVECSFVYYRTIRYDTITCVVTSALFWDAVIGWSVGALVMVKSI